MSRLTPISEILPAAVADLLPQDARRESTLAALAECRRRHRRECENPVEEFARRDARTRKKAPVAEEQRSFLDEFADGDRARVAGHFAEARQKHAMPDAIVDCVVDNVNRYLRSYAGGGPHYDTDCQLVRLCFEKRDLALAYACQPAVDWQVRAKLLDTWASLWRVAISLGLEPGTLPQDADVELIRQRGSELWYLVRAAQQRQKGG